MLWRLFMIAARNLSTLMWWEKADSVLPFGCL